MKAKIKKEIRNGKKYNSNYNLFHKHVINDV